MEGNIDVADDLFVEKLAIIHRDIKAEVITITPGVTGGAAVRSHS